MADTIDISENKILNIRLIDTQMRYIESALKNIELQKQILLADKKAMEEDFEVFKKEVSAEYNVNYDDYLIDVSQKKLIKKKN